MIRSVTYASYIEPKKASLLSRGSSATPTVFSSIESVLQRIQVNKIQSSEITSRLEKKYI